MTDSEKLSLIKHTVLARLSMCEEQAEELSKLMPTGIKYSAVRGQIKELEHFKDLLERIDT